jgi:hypothetical protein
MHGLENRHARHDRGRNDGRLSSGCGYHYSRRARRSVVYHDVSTSHDDVIPFDIE